MSRVELPQLLTSSQQAAVQQVIAKNRSWFIALSVFLSGIGVLAIGAPFVTTIIVKVFSGWLLLICGIGQLIHALSFQDWKGALWDVAVGLIYAFVGGWLAFFPLAGLVGITILLAITFIFEGMLKFFIGLQFRPIPGWSWIVFSGSVSIIVSIMIFAAMPGSTGWALGLLTGINILGSGCAFFMLALKAT